MAPKATKQSRATGDVDADFVMKDEASENEDDLEVHDVQDSSDENVPKTKRSTTSVKAPSKSSASKKPISLINW